MRHRLTAAMIVAAVTLTAVHASAGSGALVSPRRVAPAARAELARQIDRAKQQDRAAFQWLTAARASVARLDERKRGSLAAIGPRLKTLGPRALLPMLEHAALNAPSRGSLSSSAWLAWRLGLIEAVGSFRDPRAEPVLRAMVEAELPEAPLRRAAAVAYGKLGTEAVATRLMQRAGRSSTARAVALTALGHCRRTVAAKFLAEQLQRQPSENEVVRIARALGDVGSAWAWRTPIIARSGEAQTVRRIAAQALVDAYPAGSVRARQMMARALLVIDHPDTPSFIDSARRRASPEGQERLGRLRDRFRRSPLRR